MFSDTSFWVLVPTIIFVAIAWRPAKAAILGMLDGRAKQVRDDLDRAERLREEAQALLADFERRQRDAQAEADEMVADANEAAARMRSKAREDLARETARREAQARDRIGQAEYVARESLRAAATDMALKATRLALAERFGPGEQAALVDKTVRQIRQLH